MVSKRRIGGKVGDEGIGVIIGNGKKEKMLWDLLCDGDRSVCRGLVGGMEGVWRMKKWIGESEGFGKGEVDVKGEGVEGVRGVKARRILGVGVTGVVGEFEKELVEELELMRDL